MAKKFITEKEIAFIDALNAELIQSNAQQEVIYYAISEEHTTSHDIYQESVTKVWYTPVKLFARVDYRDLGAQSTNFTVDSRYELDVFFHDKELIDRNVSPREGDFIEFGQVVFEITSISRPQLVYGQANKKIQVMCTCKVSREGQFQIHGDRAKFVNNTHPVEPSEC